MHLRDRKHLRPFEIPTPDICRTCWNYRRKVSPYELTNTIEHSSLCTFIGMKHISPTFMYIIPMYLRLTTFTKTLPQMSFHLYFLLFLFRSGARPMTLLTAGALTDPRLPATASNVCTTDARLGGVGRVLPKQKSWLRRWQTSRCCMVCLMPPSHVSCSLDNPHFNIFTLDRPTWVRNRLSAFQVVQGFSAPAGRCSSALMLRFSP